MSQPPQSAGVAYDGGFFAYMDRAATASAVAIVPELLRLTEAKSVLDVGCGRGAWLAECRRLGVSEVRGLDGPWLDPEATLLGPQIIETVDLQCPPVQERRFDLVICLEVAEHLAPAAADAFIDFLCSSGPTVCFSAAIPGQGGTGHLNEQWPEYWVTKFLARGFNCLDVLRDQFWDDERVAWCYSQNAFLFVEAALAPTVASRVRPTRPPLARVHPRLLRNTLERPTLEQLGVAAALRHVARMMPRAIKRRLRSGSDS